MATTEPPVTDPKTPGPPGTTNNWLNKQLTWRVPLGPEWEPVRALGIGSAESVTGLWTRSKTAGGAALSPTDLSHVVVKQVLARGEPDALTGLQSIGTDREFAAYELLNTVNSKHIVKMYRTMHRDVGGGTANFPADFLGVCNERLYLEFCPGGDMQGMFTNMIKGQPLEEEDVWRIFDDLARACAVLEIGTEDFNAKAWKHEIAHLDLKAANVFLGTFDDEHTRIPIIKFGDFGTAEDISKYPIEWQTCHAENPQQYKQSVQYFRRGQKNDMPPEMRRDAKREPEKYTQITSKTNIWQSAALICTILNKNEYWSHCTDSQMPCDLSEKLKAADLLHGGELYDGSNPASTTYSAELRTLVLECLLRDFTLRPDSVELQKRTQAGLEKWKGTAKNSLTHLGFENVPRAPLGSIAPSEWDEDDIDYVRINVAIRGDYTDRSPEAATYITLPRVHRAATIKSVKDEINNRLFFVDPGAVGLDGAYRSRTQPPITRIDVTGKNTFLYWKDGVYLDEDATLKALGVEDWESMTYFWGKNIKVERFQAVQKAIDGWRVDAERLAKGLFVIKVEDKKKPKDEDEEKPIKVEDEKDEDKQKDEDNKKAEDKKQEESKDMDKGKEKEKDEGLDKSKTQIGFMAGYERDEEGDVVMLEYI